MHLRCARHRPSLQRSKADQVKICFSVSSPRSVSPDLNILKAVFAVIKNNRVHTDTIIMALNSTEIKTSCVQSSNNTN